MHSRKFILASAVCLAILAGLSLPCFLVAQPPATMPGSASLNSSQASQQAQVKLQFGPILGAFDEKNFSVVCRTNLPAVLLVGPADPTVAWQLMQSPIGLTHRFNLPRGDFKYVIYAGEKLLATVQPPPFPKAGELRFVAMGDCRSDTTSWAKVAKAALATKPYLVLFSGDMVSNGREDSLWNDEFYQPASGLLSTVPLYPVMGNHEESAPILGELFYLPSPDGKGDNWSQTISDILFIGLDGGEAWTRTSDNTKWLEKTLKDSKAKFIFVTTHYPPWASARHGEIASDGKAREQTAEQGRDVIMPLLVKYHATALIAGHTHCYERSEPPGGVTVIISGGAGAPLHEKSHDAAKQNPYSKVFVSSLNFCVFEIDGDTVSMKALTPDGKELDKTQWKARQQ